MFFFKLVRNPLSVLIDAKIGFSTSFGEKMSFIVGLGSSQLVMLRLGGNTRVVLGGGTFENGIGRTMIGYIEC